MDKSDKSKHLIPGQHKFTPEELSKASKNSCTTKSFKRELMRKVHENPELISSIVDTIIEKAQDGDAKAWEVLIDLMGESVKREELKLKKKELRLKEKQLSGDTSENDMVKNWVNAVVEEEKNA